MPIAECAAAAGGYKPARQMGKIKPATAIPRATAARACVFGYERTARRMMSSINVYYSSLHVWVDGGCVFVCVYAANREFLCFA